MSRRIIFVVLNLYILVILTSCFHVEYTPPDICNPNKSVSEEQVRNDLEENKQEYLEMIKLLDSDDILISYIDFKEVNQYILLSIYTGSYEEFKEGNLNPDKEYHSYLEDLEILTEEEKQLIESFVKNRDSKEFSITNKARDDGKIYFEFFGLTYITYIDDEFYVEHRSCPNA